MSPAHFWFGPLAVKLDLSRFCSGPVPIHTSRNTIPAAGALRAGRWYEAIRFAGRWRLVASIGSEDLDEALSNVVTRRVAVTASTPAMAREADSWVRPATSYRIDAAHVNGGPQGGAVYHASGCDVDWSGAELRQLWTLASGEVYSRFSADNGMSWSVWQRTGRPDDLVPVDLSARGAALRSFDTALDDAHLYHMDGSNVILRGPHGNKAYQGTLRNARQQGGVVLQRLYLADDSPWERRVRNGLADAQWTRVVTGLCDKLVLFFGDSITAGVGASRAAETAYAAVARARLGCRSVVWGTAGAQISPTTTATEAQADGSFTRRIAQGQDVVAQADVMLVAFGTNDFNRSTPIGTLQDTVEETFCGALEIGYKSALKANPGLRIVFVLPLYRSVSASDPAENLAPNAAGHSLADYRLALIGFCRKYHLQCLDAYSHLGISRHNVLAKTTDGLHPSDAGHADLGEFVARGLIGDSSTSPLGVASNHDLALIREDIAEAVQLEDGTRVIMAFDGVPVLGWREDRLVGPGLGGDGEGGGSEGGGGAPAVQAPEGGWAAERIEVDGAAVTTFTGPAGAGLIDRFRLSGTEWHPTPREMIVLIGFGQSQSGVHQSNGEPLVWTRPPVPHHVFALDDRASGRGGERGWMGGTPLATPTRLEPARSQTVQGILSSTAASLAKLMGPERAVYAIRSEGQGGSKWIGAAANNSLYKIGSEDAPHAQPFLNFVASTREMIRLGRAAGHRVERVFVALDHGEADQNTARDVYIQQTLAVQADFAAALADLEVDIQWIIMQPVGGDSVQPYNNWGSREAMVDLAGEAGVTLGFLKSQLEINAADGSHTSYRGRVVLGEMYAHVIRALLEGRGWSPPVMAGAQLDADDPKRILVDFASQSPMRIHPGLYLGPARNIGFEIRAGNRLVPIEAARQIGPRRFELVAAEAATGARLGHAYWRQDAGYGDLQGKIPTGGTRLADGWEAPSLWQPGVTLIRAALGSSIAL